MTQDEIIEMALKAGAKTSRLIWPPTFTKSIDFTLEGLEAFFNLAAAKEREACAKVAERINVYDHTIAAAIRARGKA
jgi:hypothetical protein